MPFIPGKSVIEELPLPKEEVMEKLLVETQTYLPGEPFRRGKKLRGLVKESGFEVSLNPEFPGRFLPVVTGTVEKAGKGSRVLLHYQLTKATRRSLVIMLSVTFLATVFFVAGYGRWIYGSITFSMGLVQYILTWKNFRLQTKRTSRVLKKILHS